VQAPSGIAVERDAVVGNVLAEIRLDHVDAGGEKRRVLVAPERERIGVREVDDRRRRKRRQHVAER
jgi:hypothetical protein